MSDPEDEGECERCWTVDTKGMRREEDGGSP